MSSRAKIYAEVRAALGRGLKQDEVEAGEAWLDFIGVPKDAPSPSADASFSGINLRIALELIEHEAIVQEAYKDSEGIWTWGVGVTNASGHNIDRYRDNPQTIARCIEIYLWLCQKKYGPEVIEAFKSHALTESQFAAALSFHYNTGAIGRASWVSAFLRGDIAEARERFMDWRRPSSIIERRKKERDLFFDGKWSQTGTAMVWPVRKPRYTPDWSKGTRRDVSADIQEALS
jgi:lysozyme